MCVTLKEQVVKSCNKGKKKKASIKDIWAILFVTEYAYVQP